jgi:hypothetical protein
VTIDEITNNDILTRSGYTGIKYLVYGLFGNTDVFTYTTYALKYKTYLKKTTEHSKISLNVKTDTISIVTSHE